MNLGNMELHSSSNEDFILYMDTHEGVGIEVQFDKGVFNGKVALATDLGTDNEVWEFMDKGHLFEIVKNKAVTDYEKLGFVEKIRSKTPLPINLIL